MILCACAVFGVMLIAATSRSDELGTTDRPPSVDLSAPPTEPVVHAPTHDPFAPFDVGPPAGVWSYDQLSPEEKAVVDRGRDTAEWARVNEGYNAAIRQQTAQSNAAMAGRMLGLTNAVEAGVVP